MCLGHFELHRFPAQHNPWVREIPVQKEMAAHSSILAWEMLWTGEPGGLQSLGSQELDMT